MQQKVQVVGFRREAADVLIDIETTPYKRVVRLSLLPQMALGQLDLVATFVDRHGPRLLLQRQLGGALIIVSARRLTCHVLVERQLIRVGEVSLVS